MLEWFGKSSVDKLAAYRKVSLDKRVSANPSAWRNTTAGRDQSNIRSPVISTVILSSEEFNAFAPQVMVTRLG